MNKTQLKSNILYQNDKNLKNTFDKKDQFL
jgi:hypothetical protein